MICLFAFLRSVFVILHFSSVDCVTVHEVAISWSAHVGLLIEAIACLGHLTTSCIVNGLVLCLCGLVSEVASAVVSSFGLDDVVDILVIFDMTSTIELVKLELPLLLCLATVDDDVSHGLGCINTTKIFQSIVRSLS